MEEAYSNYCKITILQVLKLEIVGYLSISCKNIVSNIPVSFRWHKLK